MSQSYSCLTEVGKSPLQRRVVCFDVIQISFLTSCNHETQLTLMLYLFPESSCLKLPTQIGNKTAFFFFCCYMMDVCGSDLQTGKVMSYCI